MRESNTHAVVVGNTTYAAVSERVYLTAGKFDTVAGLENSIIGDIGDAIRPPPEGFSDLVSLELVESEELDYYTIQATYARPMTEEELATIRKRKDAADANRAKEAQLSKERDLKLLAELKAKYES